MSRFLDQFLTRRQLIRLAGIAGGSLFAGVGCNQKEEAPATGPPSHGGADPPLHRAIRVHFDYLSIDDQVIDAFARDLEQHQGSWVPETSPRPFTRFLASTDFFQNGADESRALRYVTYYDPYVSSCYDPFRSSEVG